MRWTALAAGAWRASQAAANQASVAMTRSTVALPRRSRRTGVLAPGDPPPPASVGGQFWDYRGLALPNELAALDSGLFPLGSAVHPHHGIQQSLWLPWSSAVRHTAVVGPPGSGKTVGIVAPWITCGLRAGISVVAVDVKGDLLDEVRSYAVARPSPRPHRPTVRRWDLADPAGSTPWNFLDEVADQATLEAAVLALLGPASGSDQNREFRERDHRWLRGLVQVARATLAAPVPVDLLRLATNRRLLESSLNVPAGAAAGYEVADLVRYEDDEFARQTSFLVNRLAWFATPEGRRLCGRSGFAMRDVLASPGLLIIGARPTLGHPGEAASSLALSFLRQAAFGRFGASPPPMLWVLDEVARYADRIDLPGTLEIVRGAEVAVCAGLQDLSQLGEDTQRRRVLANFNNLVTLAGCSPGAAEYLSQRLGRHGVGVATASIAQRGQWMRGLGREMRPVLYTREIMYPPWGSRTAIAHVPAATSKPFALSLDRD